MRAVGVRPAALAVIFAGLYTASAVVVAQQSGPDRLPPSLADYLNRVVKMPAADQTKLLQGLPVTRLLDADPATEVAIFGAVWVNAPIERYVAAVKDIERLEKGDNGAGFWFAAVNRSRSDGLSGFVGSLLRGKVRDEAEKGMQAALRSTKTTLENGAHATAK